MYKLKHTYKAIFEWGKSVIKRAQKNLNTTGFRDKGRKISPSGSDLYESLDFGIQESENGLIQDFGSSVDYAPFVEEGRKPGKFVPIAPLEKYIRKRNIKLRKTFVNSNGQRISQFVPMTDKNVKSAAFGMSLSIKKKGIEASNFFGDALDYEFDELPPEVQEALVNDMIDFTYEDLRKKGENVTIQ